MSFSFLTASAAFAATWKDKCPDMKACVNNYSELSGQQYIFDKDHSNLNTQMSENLPFVKEDAELIFTNILYENGMSRVPVKQNVYSIMRLNDAKGKDVPLIACSREKAPVLPNTYDLVTLAYQFTNQENVREAENVIRTYADMGARIYGVEGNGQLLLTDVAKHMSKLYQILVSLDVKPSPEVIAKRKAREEAQLKEIASGVGRHGGDLNKKMPPSHVKADRPELGAPQKH